MSTKSEIQALLAEIDAEIGDAERLLANLRLQRRGAEALQSRLLAQTVAPTTATVNGQGSGHTSVVAAILSGRPEGLDLRAIQDAAAERGHPLNYDQVRSAVTYLRRKGQTENIGRGVWRSTRLNVPLSGAPHAAAAPQYASSPGASGLEDVPSRGQEVANTG